MFERLKEWREMYSQSYPTHKDPTLRTIYVKMGQAYLANKIIDILKDLRYKSIVYNDTFYEIFTSKAGYEVTVTLTAGTSGSVSLNVSVYSPSNRGKTRKALRFLLNKFNEELKGYTTNE